MSTEIIGRDAELATLRAFLDALPGGPAVLVLQGEAGMGKTTLWRAGIEAADERSFRVLAASPTEAEATMSFAALDDLLGAVVETVLPELPPPQHRALEVALLRAEAEKGPVVDPRAVSVAFLNALRQLAASTSVLVAVDDVQWLDAASAGVLGYAARRLRDTRVGVLLSKRIGETTSLPRELEWTLGSDGLLSVTVGPLTTGALHRLVRERLGAVLPRPVLRRVHGTSGGNPFYALEIARALEREGLGPTPGKPLPVPASLGELLRSRIDALPAETRAALLVASGASEPRVAVLASVLELDARAALRPAIDAHIVALEGDRVRFAHPLLADAAYSAADELDRRDVHHRLAVVVDDSDERARHLALAAEGPDEAVAAALEQAAARARARGATAAAAELCEQAVRLTPPELEDGTQRRTVATAHYRFDAGETAGARSLLEDALPSLRAGELRAEALVQLQRVYRFEGDQPRAAELAREALAEQGVDQRVRAAAAQGLAFTLFFMREDLAAALGYARLSAHSTPPDAPHTFQMETLHATGLLEAVLGRKEAVATLQAAEELGVDDLVDVLNSARWARVFVAHWTDDLAGVVDAVSACRRDALARGQEGSIPMILALEGLVHYLTGGWGYAAELLEDGYDLALQTGQLPQQAYTLSVRALLQASAGAEAEARTDATSALALAGERGMTVARIYAVSALGLLELSLGRPDETARVIGPLRRQLLAAGVGEPGSIRFLPDEIEALIGLGRVQDAEELLRWLEERGQALDRASALGAAARCRGLIAGAAGDLDGALAALEQGLIQHEKVPIPFDRARTLLALGSAQRRAKKKSEARETLEHARSLFAELGAAIWEEKAKAELARIGGRAPSRNELTPTERRVAELVAQGKTNKEVAAALFVSDRTVEFHLSHVYRKLGVRSRAELARTFSR